MFVVLDNHCLLKQSMYTVHRGTVNPLWQVSDPYEWMDVFAVMEQLKFYSCVA